MAFRKLIHTNAKAEHPIKNDDGHPTIPVGTVRAPGFAEAVGHGGDPDVAARVRSISREDKGEPLEIEPDPGNPGTFRQVHRGE